MKFYPMVLTKMKMRKGGKEWRFEYAPETKMDEREKGISTGFQSPRTLRLEAVYAVLDTNIISDPLGDIFDAATSIVIADS